MFKRKRSKEDFAEEIQAHLDLEADQLIREGLTEQEARRRSRVAFGNVQAARERFALGRGNGWFAGMRRDFIFVARQLRKNASFSVISIFVLALGMGTSMAIFAFVDAAFLEPLPYESPNRLMSVNESSATSPRWPLSYPDYIDWQELNRSFKSLDIYSGQGFLLHTPSGTVPVMAERVTGTFFQTLGVQPALGRDFASGENRPDGPDVMLLSDKVWRTRFGSRTDIVGQAVDLDDRDYTIIGVLPREFSFAPSANAEFWLPLNRFTPHEKQRTFYNFWGVARLRDGASQEAAQAEMTTIAGQLQRKYGVVGRGLGAAVMPLSQMVIGDVRPILLTLLGGSLLLLVIACTNVANLVLIRSESRKREVAVRSALGATRFRLASQFVAEALLLSSTASITAVAIAFGLIRLFASLVPIQMASKLPFLSGVGITSHTVVFAVATSVLSTLLLASIPVVRLSFQAIQDGLTEGDRGSAGRHWQRLGSYLVVAELTLAVVLLGSAGLLGRSLYGLLHAPLGFNPDHLATLRVQSAGDKYKDADRVADLYQEVERQIRAVPGVEAVGMTSVLPAQCDCSTDSIQIMGRPHTEDHEEVDERHVSAGYLPGLKAGLLRGRWFTQDDSASKPGVAIVNQTLARKFFPQEDPIGQRIVNNEGGHQAVWEIVGVVDDVREGPLDASISPAEYFPMQQTYDGSFLLVVRTKQNAADALPALVNSIRSVDRDLGVSDEGTLVQKIAVTQAALLHQATAWLVGVFAVVALLLGAVGLYGVVSHSVAQRTREIGVRMALGAQRSTVYRMVMQQAVWLAGAGVVLGVLASVATSMLIRNLLYGVRAWDPATLSCVALVLAAASLVASFLPARRAASVNPVDALRVE